MTALLFCFEKMASVVDIKTLSLKRVESDEGDVESTESRDASSFEEDVEISSFEKSSNFDLGFHWIMRRREKSPQVSSQWHLIL